MVLKSEKRSQVSLAPKMQNPTPVESCGCILFLAGAPLKWHPHWPKNSTQLLASYFSLKPRSTSSIMGKRSLITASRQPPLLLSVSSGQAYSLGTGAASAFAPGRKSVVSKSQSSNCVQRIVVLQKDLPWPKSAPSAFELQIPEPYPPICHQDKDPQSLKLMVGIDIHRGNSKWPIRGRQPVPPPM